ncbi:undecaprenyl/decaprenyl-phosphate alpha-N-acetylglucosaminyl 1-phosphate transferase [Rathayibacter tritici]|nr:undecaprenyl/decaprenyl-phosphate alpha-N-acetylglucosaminyl 1-phosphate transferase [Rathayibacter tritici]PPF69459.1 undecaprenyl/decaprenyl-phosphate alpha-N-acetylglucosaminyl 1-phosphate transferase [Rathayibacter tritici]PPG08329.1 undecaprenyl/decaprenyl-phosphate alpha-N-acetylglucosaminyl 1-phosphate transferase [Rathayibacter tritici]PPI14253.1 undecaprenyl/decaprenyl-phosphate alpha-N-acetylglucosaminyl 1-phosphate transferase [Rathayibacter tritici]PPI43635.1 undecaprenyl/decapre
MTFALVSLAVALVTGALSWVIWRLSLKYRLYPKIRVRDMHTRPTPRLGGIAMFLGILVGFGVASQLPYFRLVFANPEPILAILGASLLIVLIGVADDIWDLDWTTKLAGQLIAAGLIAWKGVQIVSLPIGGLTVGSPWMSLIITVLAIVLVTNALNFIDGLDGLVAGVALIANGVFFLYSYLLVQQTSPTDYFNLASLIAVVLVGACAGFLPINWRPARMFMGDSGALLVGMLMATSAIAVTGQIDPAQLAAKELLPAFIPIILPFAILVVPLMDFGLAVIRRLRAGKSPFSADRKHLHHRLLDMGHSHLHAVLIFYGWTAVVAVSCLLMFVVDVLWVPLVFLSIGLLACTVVTLAPLSRRKRLEAAAQSAEASPVLDPLDRASSTEQLRPPAGLPIDRDTTAPIVAQKEAS